MFLKCDENRLFRHTFCFHIFKARSKSESVDTFLKNHQKFQLASLLLHLLSKHPALQKQIPTCNTFFCCMHLDKYYKQTVLPQQSVDCKQFEGYIGLSNIKSFVIFLFSEFNHLKYWPPAAASMRSQMGGNISFKICLLFF